MARNRDRISNMPEPILQFILSLVPLKSAVRPSILSRRWRNLWEYNLLSATSLDFGEEFTDSCQSVEEFVTTVDRYLQVHSTQKLERFRICFGHADIIFLLPNVERWIALVAKKGVKQLIIDVLQHDPRKTFHQVLVLQLPRYLDEDSFELDRVIQTLKTPRSVIFNNLKMIKLSNFRGGADEMRLVRFLLKRAIVLESLIIVTPPPLDLKEWAYGGHASSSPKYEIKKRKPSSFLQLLILPKASPNVCITVYDFFEDDSSLKPTHTQYYCERSFCYA